MTLKRATFCIGLVAAVVLSISSAAAGDVPRMGDQHVGLFACAFAPPCDGVSLTADEAFSVAHGFSAEPKADLVNPLHRFELRVDGVQRHGAIDLDLGLAEKWYVFNFPQGMSGTHVFTGCWYATDGSTIACGSRVVH